MKPHVRSYNLSEYFSGQDCGQGKTFASNYDWWHYQNLQQKSKMFSKARKKWIDGPILPVGLKFTNACGISLNRSKVLFVGVSRDPFDMNMNNITIMYDIEENRWQFHEELSTPHNKNPLHYCSCAVTFEKNGERRCLSKSRLNDITMMFMFNVHFCFSEFLLLLV